jgi:lactoylglutathione lyase
MELDYIVGLQHIGIPTNDMEKAILFYEKIGFEVAFKTVIEDGTVKVSFLKLHNLIIELYENNLALGKAGAIDHISIDVTDIEKVFEQICKKGLKILNDGVQFLPFFENGVKFFTIEGPNGEKIEFNQRL